MSTKNKQEKYVEMYYGLGSNRIKPGRKDHQYPQGDGKPDCKRCHGRGVVPMPEGERPPFSVGEVTKPCLCTFHRDTLLNMERGWKNLTKCKPFHGSVLLDFVKKNLWATADLETLRNHLGWTAYRQGRRWRFKVTSDVALMTAWLYTANEIFDEEVDTHRHTQEEEDRYSRIDDLVGGWDLLVIRVGVKAARNQAAPEVLLEALRIREQAGLPTWVVDSPSEPWEVSFDQRIAEHMEMWERRVLSDKPRREEGAQAEGESIDQAVQKGYSGAGGIKTMSFLPTSSHVPVMVQEDTPDEVIEEVLSALGDDAEVSTPASGMSEEERRLEQMSKGMLAREEEQDKRPRQGRRKGGRR